MDIEIRCEQCNTYLEIEKEWTDRNGINITVSPCSELGDAQALADKLLVMLKEIAEVIELWDMGCPICGGWNHRKDCELAEAIDAHIEE